MALWTVKVICLLLILILTVFFGLLPLIVVSRLRRRQQEETANRARPFARKLLGYLNCFSGGIFFATCFIHLFPEVIEKCNDVMRKASLDVDYPIPELLISAGFFLIMLIEHCAMSCKTRRGNVNLPGSGPPEDRIPRETDPLIRSPSASSSSATAYGNGLQERHVQRSPDSISGIQDPDHTAEDVSPIQGLRAIVVLIALSIHSLFAGLALGLETTIHSTWMLFAAISVHKSAVAFTLGLQFADTFQRACSVITYMTIFCTMSPIGISIGTAITAINQGSLALDVTSMVLQGLATGTFIYVTFFEILQKEVGAGDYGVIKVFFVFLGFGTICLGKLLGG